MKKFGKIFVLSLVLLLLFGAVYSSAYVSYDTYTYSISGKQMLSPNAYSTNTSITWTKMGLDKELVDVTDIVTDENGNVYISDTGNKRIVVLDSRYKVTAIVDSYYNDLGEKIPFSNPQGIYVTTENTADGDDFLYVCDSSSKCIVVFNSEFEHTRTITSPTNGLFSLVGDKQPNYPDNFAPSAIAVDRFGRIFVVSPLINQGVIGLSGDGLFTGFIGAQKVTFSKIEELWKDLFTSSENTGSFSENAAISFNNLTVDEDGFIYATVHDPKMAKEQFDSIKSKSADYSPVKKINSTGHQIMKRNGFFDPGGEVDILDASEVSQIYDVALGPEGTWTILDRYRSRLFTYDQSGNLLFAFGDKGDVMGNSEDIQAITYQKVDGVSYILVLDNTKSDTTNKVKLNVYSPTEYCDTIINALRNQNNHEYSTAIEYWQELLTRNNNFDLAYIGIGKAYFSQREYEKAYEVLQNAYETDYASKAFAEIRKDTIGRFVLPLAVALIVLLVLFAKFLGYAKKKNKATSLKVGRKTYWEELLYSFHLVFHPFDGFWDLKHEKRGSVRAASTILGMTVIAFFYNAIGEGYLFNPEENYTNIFVVAAAVVGIVILWAVSNWCLTTLFDGEGSFKDIYIATCYSLAPLPLFVIVSTILSNVLTTTEGAIVTLVMAIGIVWTALLLFFGTLVTHDYPMGKNVITILGTLLAMIIIVFIILLFGTLVLRMITFVGSIFKEISNRM